MWARWKAAELQVSEFFGGKRRIRVTYSEEIGDIIHPHYSIEVKYGKQIPKYLITKHPLMLVVGKRKFRVFPSSDILIHRQMISYNVLFLTERRRKTAKFLLDAITQAKRYNPDLRPVVAVKSPRMRGFVIVWEAA